MIDHHALIAAAVRKVSRKRLERIAKDLRRESRHFSGEIAARLIKAAMFADEVAACDDDGRKAPVRIHAPGDVRF